MRKGGRRSEIWTLSGLPQKREVDRRSGTANAEFESQKRFLGALVISAEAELLPQKRCRGSEFESCLSSNTKQKMGKGILVNEHMDSSRVNMQTEILSSSNVTPQDHSSQLNLEGEGDDDDEDANECEEYWDIGDPTNVCEYCGAYFWFEERVNKQYKSKRPVFNICCNRGKIKLPNPKDPPQILTQLLFGSGPKSDHFRENIKIYNSMFSFTSMGGKVDVSVNQTRGPRTFKLSGQNYHQIGSLLPPDGSNPKFAQLYIYDTENEVQNRIHAVSLGQNMNKLHVEIVNDLKQMLDGNNVLAKTFRMWWEILNYLDVIGTSLSKPNPDSYKG
ncbi:PREDICTED: uncharacterized protein LOC109236589 [Nicotiana attenuata]|uniref:uncharacterized protein LOC109236589 n=1 Tax=Nicotiana attenuata TaxID=49451 RepID=UPI0009057767|nr:PREDICTED: uncharacterized protein LOC109236589 [Nicotiana attenuata]